MLLPLAIVEDTHLAIRFCPVTPCIALLPDNLPLCLQELCTGEHNIFPTLHEPLPSDNALCINQEKSAFGDPVLGKCGIARQAAILLGHLHIRKVAEEWIWQLQRLCERLLREGMVRADSENLDIQLLEFGVIGLPG
jgi:hypothetical protein